MKKDSIVSQQVVVPFVLVTSLFGLWGLANAVNDPMVSAFKKVLELNNLQASLVQLAFYGGYFTMALPASMIIRKYSYKTGVIVGLALYATGALLFYPAAVTEPFSFFLIGLYILTFGLAFLDPTANPYILAIGSPKTATQRLNLAQAINPLGLLGSLWVAQQFVLSNLQSDDLDFAGLSETTKVAIRQADLMVIRDPYVALGVVVIVILVIIAINKMPESKGERVIHSTWEIIIILFKKKKYTEGVVAQGFYVGAQIMCWTYIYQYAESIGVESFGLVDYQFIAFVLFFVGRFVCTLLLKYSDSEKLLMALSAMLIIFVLGTIFIQGIFGLYSLVAISFCMSLIFPTIYGISLEGLSGDEAKIGAAGLVMAIVGGALMPILQGAILDIGGGGYQDTLILGVPEVNFLFVLSFVCFLFIAYYGYSVFSNYKNRKGHA